MGFGTYVCYSLPRMISPAIQCSFLTYFFEMYTTEFGWSMAEYGTVQTLYSRTQILSFFIFGIIFAFANAGRAGAMSIEVIGTIMQWITYFLLIFLPIKWHGVKTPYVDSMLGSTSDFGYMLVYGPIRFPKMKIGRKISDVLFLFSIPIRLVWAVLYIVVKVCFLCIVNFGAILWALCWPFRIVCKCCCLPFKLCRKPKVVEEILPVLETLESIPPPACSACCNTTCCNGILQRFRSWRRFTKTRTFGIYFLVFVHGVGMSMHELSNKALESYVGIGSINTNLTFFFGSNIVIYTIFSFVKLYVHSKAAFTETFYLLAIVFLALQIIILPIFGFGTQGNYTPDGIEDPGFAVICIVIKWLSATVFHSTVVFLIFSGGPLIFYVSIFILGGHKVLMSFGNLVLFGSLNMTSFFFMILGALEKAENPFDPNTQMIVSGACIVGQLLTFFILYPHDWPWNKGNWVNYILLIVTGFVNSKFVAYANYMLGVGVTSDFRAKKYAWIFNGGFYSGTNVVVSTAMPKMFNAFGQNEVRECGCGCYRISYNYCFPTVYKTITGVFILLNIIALGIFVLAHYLDRLFAALAVLVDKGNALKTAAGALTDPLATADLPKFKAAAQALKDAGDALNNFATLLHQFSQDPLVCNQLFDKKSELDAAKTKFQTAAGNTNSGFRGVATTLGSNKLCTGNDGSTGCNIDLTTGDSSFSNVNFSNADFGSAASATDLQTKATEFQTAAGQFQSAANDFNDKAQDAKSVNTANAPNIQTDFVAAAGNFQTGAKDLYRDIKNKFLLSLL